MTTLHDIVASAPSIAEGLRTADRRIRAITAALTAPLVSFWRYLVSVRRRQVAEQQLLVLSNRTLKDIGIARSQIPWIATAPGKQWRGPYY